MKKILLVDDDHQYRRSLAMLIKSFDHEVVEARGGIEALNLLVDGLVVDAIITDRQMPGGDGVELLQGILREFDSPPPTLIHSSEVNYWPRGGTMVDLCTHIPEFFGTFARFERKGEETMTIIRDFLEKLPQ